MELSGSQRQLTLRRDTTITGNERLWSTAPTISGFGNCRTRKSALTPRKSNNNFRAENAFDEQKKRPLLQRAKSPSDKKRTNYPIYAVSGRLSDSARC